jgi:GxxExxY protein
MENKACKLKLQKLRKIAEDVYRSLGSGFQEVVYEKAMCVGLRLTKIKYENQKVLELKYKNHYVGEGYPDLVVKLGRDTVIIELKTVGGEMGPAEEQQLINYMKIMKVKYGLLINFQLPSRKEGKTKLEVKEICL